MTRTPEHEAALDALEEVMRFYGADDRGIFFGMSEALRGVAGALVEAGRMEWVEGEETPQARLTPKPKPLLSEEQVAEVMELAFQLATARAHALRHATATAMMAADQETKRLRDHLTSMTQEGE